MQTWRDRSRDYFDAKIAKGNTNEKSHRTDDTTRLLHARSGRLVAKRSTGRTVARLQYAVSNRQPRTSRRIETGFENRDGLHEVQDGASARG